MNRQPGAHHGSHSHGYNLQPQAATGLLVSAGGGNGAGQSDSMPYLTPTEMGLA